MSHTTACTEEAMAAKEARITYLLLWPNACGRCNGTGVHYYSGSREEPPSMDMCADCYGHCPRCDEQFWLDTVEGEALYDTFISNDGPCPYCGYRIGHMSGMPYEYECWGCGEDDEPPEDW